MDSPKEELCFVMFCNVNGGQYFSRFSKNGVPVFTASIAEAALFSSEDLPHLKNMCRAYRGIIYKASICLETIVNELT